MNLELDLARANRDFAQDPQGLVRWALDHSQRPVITTKFGPFAAVLLHMVTRERPDIPVLWMDSGYGTPATYIFADELARQFKLNLHVYHPLRSRAHREAVDGPPPGLDDPPALAAFTREVKLEPFERATAQMQPDVWFTALRADQTEHRAQMQPLSVGKGGLVKVAPLLRWSSKQMNDYVKQHKLPNNFDYFDPTKIEAQRECGLHLAY